MNPSSPAAHIPITARLPNLLIAGVKKAGTTSLFEWLGQHPDIVPSDIKAPNHFADLRRGVSELPPLESYVRHFSHAASQPYRLESSSTYFSGGHVVAEHIRDVLGDVHVLVTLRDPVDRLWSDYSMKARDHARDLRHMDFAEYVDRCRRAHVTDDGDLRHGFSGFRRGLYADDADAWFDVFDDRLRIVFLEHWATDPVAVMHQVCEWLDIDPRPMQDVEFTKQNSRVDYRSRAAAATARRVYHRAVQHVPAARHVKPLLRHTHDRLNAFATPERMPASLRQELVNAYREDGVRLDAILRARGQGQLPEWLLRTREVDPCA